MSALDFRIPGEKILLNYMNSECDLYLITGLTGSGNRYEQEGRARTKVKAQKLWFAIMESQIETGTPYMLYKDSCNRKSNQQVYPSNYLSIYTYIIYTIYLYVHNLSIYLYIHNLYYLSIYLYIHNLYYLSIRT